MKNPAVVDGLLYPNDGYCDSLFICCSSYEERSALGVRRLSSQYRTNRSIICRSIEYADKGRAPQHFEEINACLKSASHMSPEIAPFEIEGPIGFVRSLGRRIDELHDENPLRAVTVDISTFPRQELLLLLRYLDNHPMRGQIRLLYGEPAQYATEEKNIEHRWLTRGVKSVHPVPGFGGIQLPRLPKILVIILGHEGERTHICLRRHQPDKIVFIPQGESQHHKGLREISAQQNEEIILLYGARNIWNAGLPSRGVVETAEVISEIFRAHRYSYNMFISPNGTKLQLIGAYLAARQFPEIQLTYAVPAVYNWENYSTGTGLLWELTLEPCGHIPQNNGQ